FPGTTCVMSWQRDFAAFRERLGEFMHGVAFGRYEAELRKQTAELNDLFLLLCFMEATALPNPATLYLLEVYPYLLEQFHRSPRVGGPEPSPAWQLSGLLPPLSNGQWFSWGGKGGVEKPPASRPSASPPTGRGRRVRLVTTDPAHSPWEISSTQSVRPRPSCS